MPEGHNPLSVVVSGVSRTRRSRFQIPIGAGIKLIHPSAFYIIPQLKIKIYRTIILPVVLYGCETWSVTLREERRLRVFENTVLRRVFGPKKGRGNRGMEEIT